MEDRQVLKTGTFEVDFIHFRKDRAHTSAFGTGFLVLKPPR